MDYMKIEVEKSISTLDINKKEKKFMDRSKLADQYEMTYDELEFLWQVFYSLPRLEGNKVDLRDVKYELEKLDIPRVNKLLDSIQIKDNQNLLPWKEFQDVIATVSGNPASMEFEEETFKEFDYGKTGTVTAKDLRQYCDETKIHVSDDTLKNVIKVLDSNWDGAITFNDVYKGKQGWASVVDRSLVSTNVNSFQNSMQNSVQNSLQNSLQNSRRGSHDLLQGTMADRLQTDRYSPMPLSTIPDMTPTPRDGLGIPDRSSPIMRVVTEELPVSPSDLPNEPPNATTDRGKPPRHETVKLSSPSRVSPKEDQSQAWSKQRWQERRTTKKTMTAQQSPTDQSKPWAKKKWEKRKQIRDSQVMKKSQEEEISPWNQENGAKQEEDNSPQSPPVNRAKMTSPRIQKTSPKQSAPWGSKKWEERKQTRKSKIQSKQSKKI